MCQSEAELKFEDQHVWLECDRPGIAHELHYDETFDITWKEGQPDG
jgi:hypothetical protein